MADVNGGDASASNLNLTSEEKQVYGVYFRQADPESVGVVTGDVAVKFFEKTRLEPRILGEIWQIADKENRGFLTPAGFGIVLRLIGHYQAGQDPTPDLALRPGPLPNLDGSQPGPQIQAQQASFPSPLQPQTSGTAPIRVPPLTAEKVSQYSALFERSGAQNGVLPGEQAKSIFERAGLPNEILGRIWNLADAEQRGALIMTEFIIAMHLLASFKSGAMRSLPSVLPAGLYEAAARRPPARQMSATTAAPPSAVPRQFSGIAGGRAGSPLGRSAYTAPPQAPQLTGQLTGQMTGQSSDWAISPMDKSRFDSIYATLDKTNKGFITGDEAVPFFSNSKLSEDALAQIWDLADISSQGRLSRDEFAVAMYLIRQQRGRKDGRDNLPTSLPANLIPPSMRNQSRPAAQPTAPDFDAAPAPQMQRSAAEDLFGLDALASPAATPAPAPAQIPQSTGSSAYNVPLTSARGSANVNSPRPISPQHTTNFKPFVPSSSFGRTLNSEAIGQSGDQNAPVQRVVPQSSNGMDDLLGDGDPEISKKLTNETTELANLSNQVGSLSNQMQEVQGQKSTAQNELNQASAQKREFEGRLAQLRSLYEQEVKDVNALKERLGSTKSESQKAQSDLAMIEATYQDLQHQHQQLNTSLEADQQENVTLKEKIRTLNVEVGQLKPQLEKLKSDARQLKGLVAINKKQVATNESERDRLKAEIDENTRGNEELSREVEASSREVEASAREAESSARELEASSRENEASSQVQRAPNVASPAMSTMSANNPFFRHQTSNSGFVPSSATFPQSPEPAHNMDRSFDNVFGPSFSAAHSTTNPPMPPTSFRQEVVASHDVPTSAKETALPHTDVQQQPSDTHEATLHDRNVHSVAEEHTDEHENAATYHADNALPSYFNPSSQEVTSQEVSSPGAPISPQPRHIGSSFSPFSQGQPESSSSSHHVSAPTSRFADFGGSSANPNRPSQESGITTEGLQDEENFSSSRAGAIHDDPLVAAETEIPGAFPEEGLRHDESASNVDNGMNGQVASSNKSGPVDPFSFGKEEAKSPAASKNDFDSAFASFGPSNGSQPRQQFPERMENSTPARNVAEEFPPMRVLERDDESDTESEAGFDDDFNSGSPDNSRETPAAQNYTPNESSSAGASAPSGSSLALPRPVPVQNISVFSTTPNPPTPGAQKSPPTYDSISSPFDRAHADSDQYAGLLPSREDPTHSPNQPFSVPRSNEGETTFAGPSVSAKPSAPHDDFDDEFDDLEDAKEGDADDDFANVSAHDRSGIDDFNPMFDSPTVRHNAKENNGFGTSTNGFGDYTQSPTESRPTATMTTAPPPPSDSHDWDAIFSGLDGPAAGSSTMQQQNEFEPPPGPPPSRSTNAATTKPRPEVGRALTEAGEHDDPILKNLTSMGYNRRDALAALEKYDYNLERAANFLASQS